MLISERFLSPVVLSLFRLKTRGQVKKHWGCPSGNFRSGCLIWNQDQRIQIKIRLWSEMSDQVLVNFWWEYLDSMEISRLLPKLISFWLIWQIEFHEIDQFWIQIGVWFWIENWSISVFMHPSLTLTWLAFALGFLPYRRNNNLFDPKKRYLMQIKVFIWFK